MIISWNSNFFIVRAMDSSQQLRLIDISFIEHHILFSVWTNHHDHIVLILPYQMQIIYFFMLVIMLVHKFYHLFNLSFFLFYCFLNFYSLWRLSLLFQFGFTLLVFLNLIFGSQTFEMVFILDFFAIWIILIQCLILICNLIIFLFILLLLKLRQSMLNYNSTPYINHNNVSFVICNIGFPVSFINLELCYVTALHWLFKYTCVQSLQLPFL